MRIAYITNAHEHSGVGHRAAALAEALAGSGVELIAVHLDGERGEVRVDGRVVHTLRPWPGPLSKKSIQWVRLGRQLASVVPNVDAYHLTNQSLSFLSSALSPSIVTVHDVIEVTDPQQLLAKWFNRYLYSGIGAATEIIAVSNYTAREVARLYKRKVEDITVIPNAVSSHFKLIPNFNESPAASAWRRRLKLAPDERVILTVSSDHPRKNVAASLRAFATVHAHDAKTVFVKVGAPGIRAGRSKTQRLVDDVHLASAVRFIDAVSNSELNELYNLASVMIFPSRAEGFGLPPLQAMAAGTPVVTSRATSLPEVVGEAVAVVDPDDSEALARHVQNILEQPAYAKRLREQGLARVQHYSWQQSAEQLHAIYKKVTS